MTPLDIEMLLHIHTTPTPYDDRGGSAQRETFNWLLSEGIIHEVTDGGAELYGAHYRTTERGDCMVIKLCDVPLPTYCWI
jgi:hypothetical protein